MVAASEVDDSKGVVIVCSDLSGVSMLFDDSAAHMLDFLRGLLHMVVPLVRSPLLSCTIAVLLGQ